MNSWLGFQPRHADGLRNLQAVRLAANTCVHLPVGFWQRRMAARAFGLSVVPPVDRHVLPRAVCWTVGGADPVFVIDTGVAVWGLAPHSDRGPVTTLQLLRAVGRRPFSAVISVVPVPVPEPLRLADRVQAVGLPENGGRRMHILPSDALQIGVLHWHDLEAVFDDAAHALVEPSLVSVASHAAAALRALAGAAHSDRKAARC